jgi:excisionase family DNA binding protein
MTPDEFPLDITQAAALIGVRERVIQTYVNAGTIPYYKLGHVVRFRRQDIEAWLEAKTTGRPATMPVGPSGTKGVNPSPDDTSQPVLRLSRGAKGRNRERLAT